MWPGKLELTCSMFEEFQGNFVVFAMTWRLFVGLWVTLSLLRLCRWVWKGILVDEMMKARNLGPDIYRE